MTSNNINFLCQMINDHLKLSLRASTIPAFLWDLSQSHLLAAHIMSQSIPSYWLVFVFMSRNNGIKAFDLRPPSPLSPKASSLGMSPPLLSLSPAQSFSPPGSRGCIRGLCSSSNQHLIIHVKGPPPPCPAPPSLPPSLPPSPTSCSRSQGPFVWMSSKWMEKFSPSPWPLGAAGFPWLDA